MMRQPHNSDAIAQRLIRAGLMDDSTGATRAAKAVSCPRCRSPVMRGLCADWGGYSIDADPGPLSPMGEVLALLSGRGTFELRWLGDHYEIDRRDHFRITGNPAGTNGIDVLVRHDCELNAPIHLPTMATSLNDGPRSAKLLPDKPPF